MSSPAYQIRHDDPGARLTDPRRPPLVARTALRAIPRSGTAGGFTLCAVDLLPGNVGYLDVDALAAARRGDSLAEAVAELSDATAMVIDLRSCRDLERLSAALLASALFETAPMHLEDVHVQSGARTLARGVAPFARYAEKPVYILVSQRTGGAAASLAASLQSLGRATIVEEP
ncbi:MAG: S41 family peptidase [Gemmatimonadaceae bacterium]